jgi:hypothetical protein
MNFDLALFIPIKRLVRAVFNAAIAVDALLAINRSDPAIDRWSDPLDPK